MGNKIFYFDTETTGLDPSRHEIIQFASIIEIDGEENERFIIEMKPDHFDRIEQTAIDVNGYTRDQLKEFPSQEHGYRKILAILDFYVDKFDKTDHFVFCGHNVKSFDIEFLRTLFLKFGNKYLFSYFKHFLDTQAIASFYHVVGKISLENLRLQTCCDYFGIKIEKAHHAMSDILATRELYFKLKEIGSLT